MPGRLSSGVKVIRFERPSFTVNIKELAALFGLELARMVVDECLGS